MRRLMCSCVLLWGGAALAADVPQFRGHNGVTTETGLPTVWNEQSNLCWKVALPGRGGGNPVIADGRVYVTACTGWQQDRLHVLCFELASGKKLWERQIWATGTTVCHNKTSMAAPTPATDGQRVFALFATGDLVCYDRAGRLQWYRSLVGDYPNIGNNVGMASSPVLVDDVVVVCLENTGDSFAAGIDQQTGENRWRLPRPRDVAWATPAVNKANGQAEVLFASPFGLAAVDAASGKPRWKLTDQKLAKISSPVCADGQVFAAGDKFLAIRPGSPTKKPEVVWQSGKLPGGYTSPAVAKGRVFMLSSRGVINCADVVSGAPLWDLRLEGSFAASPLIAGDKLYAVNEEGTTSVVDISGQPKVLSVNRLSGPILASPVAAGGCLFLRTDQFLYCVGTPPK